MNKTGNVLIFTSDDVLAAFELARVRALDPNDVNGGAVLVPLPGPTGNSELKVKYTPATKEQDAYFTATLDGKTITPEMLQRLLAKGENDNADNKPSVS